MLTITSFHVTTNSILILIAVTTIGLIAYPFGSQVDATTPINTSKVSAIDGNKNFTTDRNNISATFPLLVLFPEANEYSFGYSVTPDDKFQIEVLFNRPVDTSTVIPGTNLILAMEKNPNAPVTVNWNLNNRFLTIVTNDVHRDLCQYDPDCFFTLTLDGTEPGSIRSTDGRLLNDGFNDYLTFFVVIG